MKKILMLIILGVSLMACSVERDELNLGENEFQELNAAVEVTGCSPETFAFGEAGIIEVINDDKKLYVSIVANEGYSLVNTKLHVANNFEDFPTVGKGDNLPPGQMSFHEPAPNAEIHTFVLDLDNYSNNFLIASNSTFSKDGSSENLWAGTAVGKKGKWSYFEYSVQECTVECTEFLGPDNLNGILTVRDKDGVIDIKGWKVEDLEEYVFTSLLPAGVPQNGVFDPTLQSMVDKFNDGRVPQGLFSTTYTASLNGCSDSVKIGATVD